jgi:hypothetical protein
MAPSPRLPVHEHFGRHVVLRPAGQLRAGQLGAITLLLTGYVAYTVVLIARGMILIDDHRLAEIPGLVYVLFSTLALCLMLGRRYAELWLLFRHAPRVRGDVT